MSRYVSDLKSIGRFTRIRYWSGLVLISHPAMFLRRLLIVIGLPKDLLAPAGGVRGTVWNNNIAVYSPVNGPRDLRHCPATPHDIYAARRAAYRALYGHKIYIMTSYTPNVYRLQGHNSHWVRWARRLSRGRLGSGGAGVLNLLASHEIHGPASFVLE